MRELLKQYLTEKQNGGTFSLHGTVISVDLIAKNRKIAAAFTELFE